MQRSPNGVLAVCITVFACTLVLAFGALAFKTGDASALTSFVNTVVNVASLVLSGTATVVAGSAARSSDQAVKQTNGVLDQRIENAVRKALESGDDSDPVGSPEVSVRDI